MKCPNCQQENLDNARFCKNCGQSLASVAAGPQPSAPTMPSQAPQWQEPAPPRAAPMQVAPGPQPGSQYPGQQAQSPGQAFSSQPNQSWSAQAPAAAAPTGGTRTISRISAGSVFKVAAVIYGLLFAIFGCVFLVLPGLFGAGLLDAVAYQLGLGRSGGAGIVLVLVVYVLGILVNALLSGLIAAVAALIYNLAANWIGGIEVEVA